MARDFSAYQRELDRQATRANRRSSGSGDFQWFSPPKPARKGEKTRTVVRLLPRTGANGGDDYLNEWWVTLDQHVLTIDGKTKVFNCPDDHDREEAAKTCPLCQLRRDLYAERDPGSQETAKDLKVRSRAFAVVACPTAENERGPFVWGFSTALLSSISEIAVAKRCMVDDPDTGRDLQVTVTRIGPKRYDIRYSVTDMDPSVIDDGVRAMLDNLPDLSGLAKAADINELREIAALMDPRPGSKRASPAPTTAAAPPARVTRAEPEPDNTVDTSPPPSTGYHYSGAGGDRNGLTADDVARIVKDNPGDDHYVWVDGWPEWKPANDDADVKAAIAALTPQPITPPKPPAIPKPPNGGPPRPPSPPGGKAF